MVPVGFTFSSQHDATRFEETRAGTSFFGREQMSERECCYQVGGVREREDPHKERGESPHCICMMPAVLNLYVDIQTFYTTNKALPFN